MAPPHHRVEIHVLGHVAFRKLLGHEGRALISKMIVRIKRPEEAKLSSTIVRIKRPEEAKLSSTCPDTWEVKTARPL